METKICGKCKQEKPVNEFNLSKRDGHVSECKPCHRAACREYKASKRGKEAQSRYYHSQAKKDENARYAETNRWRRRVYTLVQRAKRIGTLLAMPCEVCGKTNAFAHHDNYDKPLEVKWLCNYHHSEYHRGQ